MKGTETSPPFDTLRVERDVQPPPRADRIAGARIVAFGGGTGMSTLLRGLKQFSENLTVVVAVSDDGGSSGRLRKDYDIPPPGDIRNCLTALSDSGDLMEKLFQYRFKETDLKGHTFGNLFLTALTEVTGNFEQAVREANRILNVRGKVLPAAAAKQVVIAHHADGSKSTGESEIARSRASIDQVSLRPGRDTVSEELRQAMAEADALVFGPGSLYTSVLPALLGSDSRDALRASEAYKIYVCNIMTQPGETAGYSAADHLAALERHIGVGIVDCMVVNAGTVPDPLCTRYAEDGARPVAVETKDAGLGVRVVGADLACSEDVVRHDSIRLASLILSILDEEGGQHE